MMRVLMTRLLASVLALLLIWQPAVAGITYYHNDALGSPVAATDENGKLLWREAYAPFGEKLNNSPAQRDSRIAYTGKLHDDDTGLTYMNARYYDPVVGRFMAIDPVGPLQGGLEHINRYDYAYNNPYKYIDSTGLYPTCDCKDDKTYEGVNESMKGNLSRTEKKSGGFGDIIAHVPIYNNLEIMGKIRDKNLFTGLFDFIDQVKTNGNMDYKKDQTLVAIYGDRVQRFGNWHYGLMAHKMGLSLNTAVLGAAGYQLGFQTTTVDNFLEAGIIASQLSVPSGRQIDRMYSIFTESGLRRALESGRTFGDNPRDGIDIMKGWDALDEWK